MKEYHGSKHAHYITQAYHRICHTERKVLDDVHPQDGTGTIAQTTTDELPIGKESQEILPSEREVTSLCKSVFHQHLPSGEQHAL